MIEKIISGGQTGVDQAALLAAYTLGIPTAEWSGSDRVEDSHGTLLIGKTDDADAQLVMQFCSYDAFKKPLFCVTDLTIEHISTDPAYRAYYIGWIVRWIDQWKIKVLNVAGNRESVYPGIGAWTTEFLMDVLGSNGAAT